MGQVHFLGVKCFARGVSGAAPPSLNVGDLMAYLENCYS